MFLSSSLVLGVSNKTAHLVTFFSTLICVIQGSFSGFGLSSSLNGKLKTFFFPARFGPWRSLWALPLQVTDLRKPGARSDLACVWPVTTLPIGYHSLEGSRVAMERGLVSKTRPVRRDEKNVLGCLCTYTCQLALQSFVKIITVENNIRMLATSRMETTD